MKLSPGSRSRSFTECCSRSDVVNGEQDQTDGGKRDASEGDRSDKSCLRTKQVDVWVSMRSPTGFVPERPYACVVGAFLHVPVNIKNR